MEASRKHAVTGRHGSAPLSCVARVDPGGVLPGTSMFTAWPEGYTKSWGLSMWCIMIMAVCPKALVSRGSDEEACHSRPDQASLCLHGGGPIGVNNVFTAR